MIITDVQLTSRPSSVGMSDTLLVTSVGTPDAQLVAWLRQIGVDQLSIDKVICSVK